MKEAVINVVERRLYDIAREIVEERKRIAEKLRNRDTDPSWRGIWETHSELVGEFYILKAALDEDPNYAVDSFDELENAVVETWDVSLGDTA